MDMRIMWNLLQNLQQMRRRERWTRPQLEAYQAEALRRLRAYAYAHSPFYQRFHQGLTDRPLQELPVLTKSMLMEHFDDLVTDRASQLEAVREHVAHPGPGELFRGRYWVNATSGSTGQPGLFLFDRTEWTAVLASFARAHEWAGLRVSLTHRMKMASVASTTPWHMSAQVGETLRSWWMPALRLAATEPLTSIVQRLNNWQPEMLVCYASMARILAEEQLADRLCIQPHVVFTSSEVLTEETRRRVEAAWGHPPFDNYAATETAELASECQAGRRLHLYEDLVIVEVVDDHCRPVPPGVYGTRVLVTTLFSRTQPLIRYELNDNLRLAASATCSCGLPFATVESVQGRVEETLHLPAVAGGRVAVQPLVFNRVLDITPSTGWQVVQEADDGLTVLVSCTRDGWAEQALVEQLSEALATQGARVPRITVRRVEAVPKAASGKAPLIRSSHTAALWPSDAPASSPTGALVGSPGSVPDA